MSAKKDRKEERIITYNLEMTPEEEAEYEAWLDANPHLRRSTDIAAKLVAGTATPEERAELRELTKRREGDREHFPGFIDDRDDEQRARDLANGRDDRTVYEDHLKRFGHPLPDRESGRE